MPRQSHDAAEVAAQAAFLRLWAPEKLDQLLELLGVPVSDREAASHKLDPRRCTVCGNGYVRCRRLDEKVPESERHDWTPDRSRSDA